MKKHQRTSLLLAAAMLLSLLASCQDSAQGEVTSAPADDTSHTETTLAPEESFTLPDMDWEGREFRVLGYENNARSQFSNFEIDSEGENGDLINDEVFRRNTLIEDKYNVVITEIRDASNQDDWTGSTAPLIQRTVMAGEDAWDLAFVNIARAGTLAREGYFTDLYELDYIDFSKDWYNQDVNDTLSINDKLYFTTSDFSLRDKSCAYILVFNKTLVEENALGDPFELVRSGEWTLDVLLEWAEAVGGDLNGNSEIDDTDMFGITMDSYNGVEAFAYGCGVRSVGKDSDGRFELTLNTQRTTDFLEKFISAMNQSYVVSSCEEYNGKVDYDFWSFAGKAFKEGRSLFTTSFPHGLKTYSAECRDDYGILPYPKYDESQEKYYTIAEQHCMLFSVPVTCPDTDFAGFMIEALSYYSTDTTLHAYYEVSCKTKYTYDKDSAEMLDITFDGIVYNPAIVYSISGVSGIFYDLGSRRSSDFASTWAKNESSALADIEKLYEDFRE